MCLQCHKNLSDANILAQMQDRLVNPKFEQFNDTSISHIIITYWGVNGDEASGLAKKVLDNYIVWKADHSAQHDDTFWGQPTAATVDSRLSEAEAQIATWTAAGIVTPEQRRVALYGH